MLLIPFPFVLDAKRSTWMWPQSVNGEAENILLEGKFAEAADAIVGVHGSQAKEIIIKWARQARNHAIAEQALSLLQSY